MTSMSREDVLPGQWSEVVSGKSRAFLQLQTLGVVRVHVGASAPAADSLVGLVLASGAAEEVAFDALETGDNIYAQSETDGTETLLVLQSSASP